MQSLSKTLHVLAIALWFGAAVFFTLSGVLMFQAFEEVAVKPQASPRSEEEENSRSAEHRPLWLPVPPPFQRDPLGEGFPDPTRKEQGSRAFGVAVGKLFPFYYGLQLACGVAALVTALAMARSGEGRGHGWRIALCALALATVGLGWWLETVVADLRGPRDKLTDDVLIASHPTPELLERARAARAAFGRWHGYSLMQNFTTLALVAVLTGLAAHLPASPRSRPIV